jgi:proteasome beta subunit
VLVAGDHRATAGSQIFSDSTRKILDLDSRTLLGIAGSPAMAFEMARVLQTSFEFYRRSQLQPMSLAAKVRALSRLLRENLPATLNGIGIVAPVLAGLAEDDSPRIYFHDPLGAQFEATDFAASGSGSSSVRAVLHHLEAHTAHPPSRMSADEAVLLANQLLVTAARFDSATGGVRPDRGDFATVRLLSPKGIHAYSNPEQAALWSKAASR